VEADSLRIAFFLALAIFYNKQRAIECQQQIHKSQETSLALTNAPEASSSEKLVSMTQRNQSNCSSNMGTIQSELYSKF
jgi:hypothetical protein